MFETVVQGVQEPLAGMAEPFAGAALMLLALAFVGSLFRWAAGLGEKAGVPPRPSHTPLRGEGLVPAAEAALRADAARAAEAAGADGIPFGGARLPLSSLAQNFLVQGCPGSGKSVFLELLLSAVMRAAHPAQAAPARLVLFDPKTEWPAKLFARLPAGSPLVLLHPFDRRGARWDVGRDFRTVAERLQLAEMLVPAEKGDANRYFQEAALDLLTALLAVLAGSGDRWTLADIVYFCRSRPRLKAVLALDPLSAEVGESYLGAKSGKDVLATLNAKLGKFAAVAACWDHADAGVSIREFMDGPGALVLGYDPRVSFALEGVNRLAVKCVTDIAVSRQGRADRTILCIDEYRQFGECRGLLDVAIQGRSSAACLLVAFQDINGVEATHKDRVARELCALLQNKVWLKAGSVEAAALASQSLGKQEVQQVTGNAQTTTNTGAARPASQSVSLNSSVTQREAVLPAEVRDLPLADPRADRLAAYYQSPVTGSFRHEGPFVGALRALPSSAQFPNFVPRPDDHQVLRPRGRADLDRLGLPPTPELLEAMGLGR